MICNDRSSREREREKQRKTLSTQITENQRSTDADDEIEQGFVYKGRRRKETNNAGRHRRESKFEKTSFLFFCFCFSSSSSMVFLFDLLLVVNSWRMMVLAAYRVHCARERGGILSCIKEMRVIGEAASCQSRALGF